MITLRQWDYTIKAKLDLKFTHIHLVGDQFHLMRMDIWLVSINKL